VNHMYKQGISGVDFIVCNTDAQALELSSIPNKVQLGASLTEGMGAGADPSVGENSAIESIEDIKRMLGSNTKMLFITAGMGGGTGTGASPVLAKAAKELGILTVAIVTTPFAFEGKRRRMQAEDGLGELTKYVDSYLVISNDRLRDIFGNLTMTAAFAKADDILTTAAKGIAEIITIPGYVNVDFKDVRTVMNDSGVAIMGNDVAEGEDRALRAVEGALASPLLKDNEIEGARYILLNITSGKQEVTMDEVTIITDYIQDKAGLSADLIWGNCINEGFENELSVTIIATGFQTSEERIKEKENERIEIPLTPEEPKASYVKPINQFVLKDKDDDAADAPEPMLRPATERSGAHPAAHQADLFSTSSSKPQLRNNTPDRDGIIRHTLTPENEHPSQADDSADDGYEVRTTASAFHFELPSTFGEEAPREEEPIEDNNHTMQDQASAYSAPKEEQVSRGADEHKTPEHVEKELLKTKERILRLKELSMKLKSANGLQELETEPAYRRKQMALDDVPHSSESQVSRFTLSTEEGITEIRPNNSFLHDNVD
ncbi:MAG TPA: cell division protein FtsZ, partial [Parapedobacter sp.]|nr:cell division protein FtsZ [Parapedobacter sp.]